jgi:hypothetical protein
MWLNQTAPRLVKPYISAIYTVIEKLHPDYEGHKTLGNGDLPYVGDREFTLRLQWYGQGGFEGLQAVNDSLEMESVREGLLAHSIVFVTSLTPVSDISTLVDQEWESRYAVDILFRMADYYVDTSHAAEAGWIDTVKINPTIDNQELNTITITTLP